MLTARIPRIQKRRGSSLQPVLPLVPEKLPSHEEDKGKFISIDLKTRVGGPAGGATYKKYVRKFEEGNPQEWIDVRQDIKEIWTQNSIAGGTDRASTIRALLRGESLTAFETALQEARSVDGEELAITPAMVTTAMNAVTVSVFPHRALEIQKLWMNRAMKKPYDLSTRKTAAAMAKINNALVLFPEGDETSKFAETEIISLLEWSLPDHWRAKFDLEGYVPTLDTKAKLIQACEAIERNEVEKAEEPQERAKNHAKKQNSGSTRSTARTGESQRPRNFYCKNHGKNPSHDTVDCYVKKPKFERSGNERNGQYGDKNRKFTNKGFRQEVNFLAKKSSRKKVLDLYSTAVKREQAKLNKKQKKRKVREAESDSDSDGSVESVHIVERPKSATRKKTSQKTVTRQRRASSTDAKTDEEKAYQRKVTWLQDHGEPLEDEKLPESEDTSSDN